MQTSLLSLILIVSVLISSSLAMAEVSGDGDSSSSSPAVHIIYTEKPVDEEPEAFHLRTLASVLGSDDAAKKALIYSYKNAASGFSAKLTAEQVSQISKQPGVLQVVPSQILQLHSEPGMLHSRPGMLHSRPGMLNRRV